MSADEEAPKPHDPPENGKKWKEVTDTKISTGQRQASAILTKLQQLECAEAAEKGAALEQAKREQERIKKEAKTRIKKHGVIIMDSQSCILAIEEATQRLQDVLSRTRHERYTRFADSQVNERRLQLRDKRPTAEAFKDQLYHNLVREKTTLDNSRKELITREEEVGNKIKDLQKLRDKLSYDTGARRLKCELETQLLKPSLEPPPALAGTQKDVTSPQSLSVCDVATDDASATGSIAPQTPAAANSSTLTVGGASEVGSLAKTSSHLQLPELALDGEKAREYIVETQRKLADVENFIEKSQDAIRRSKESGMDATTAVEKSLAKRCLLMAEIKKNLESNILDVNYAIVEADKGLAKFNKRLNPNDKKKAKTLDDAAQVLANLRKSKGALVEELRTKTEALNLDNSCRRITATVAAEKRPVSQQATRTLKQAASSPNLGRNSTTGEAASEGERTMSPALKAGAHLVVSAA